MNRTDSDSPQDFSARQGQYLAFIHAYTPPPTVHQMILTLEKAGLISRRPAAARAIAILVDPAKLPDLAPGYGQTVKTSVLGY